MKIEKLNENKLKITFNIDDLAEKNIDLYSFMHNAPETQDLFWDILTEAEKEYGFNVDNSMIYVEATTTGGGNFTLFVTKTNEKMSSSSVFTKRKNIKLKRKAIPLEINKNIFEFTSFDDVCDFSKTIDTAVIENDVLYSMQNKYYLKVCHMPYSNILEYASICNDYDLYDARLNEYGNVIIKNDALKTINKFFNKKGRK